MGVGRMCTEERLESVAEVLRRPVLVTTGEGELHVVVLLVLVPSTEGVRPLPLVGADEVSVGSPPLSNPVTPSVSPVSPSHPGVPPEFGI